MRDGRLGDGGGDANSRSTRCWANRGERNEDEFTDGEKGWEKAVEETTRPGFRRACILVTLFTIMSGLVSRAVTSAETESRGGENCPRSSSGASHEDEGL
jgi:hypothetical protein